VSLVSYQFSLTDLAFTFLVSVVSLAYGQLWSAAARNLGFEVHSFGPDETPYVMVRYDCDRNIRDAPGARDKLDCLDSAKYVAKHKGKGKQTRVARENASDCFICL
jgi:hypothetical protein